MRKLWEMVVEGAIISTGAALGAIGLSLGMKFRNKYNKYVSAKKNRQNKKAA